MERTRKYMPGRKYERKSVHAVGQHDKRKRRRNARRSLFILFTIILALVTGGFGILPDNPVTGLFRSQIAEVVPAPYLDGFNSLLVSLSEPPIEPSVEMIPIAASSLPEIVEVPSQPPDEEESPIEPVVPQVQVPTAIPTPPAVTPVPSPEIPTIILLSPNNATTLPPDGKITFSWTPVKDAVNYRLEITLPYNQTVIFDTTETSRVQYIEVLAMGGQFQWKVTAFDANGEIICSSEPFEFEKPKYIPPGQVPNRHVPSGDEPGAPATAPVPVPT